MFCLPILFFFFWSCKSYQPLNWPDKRLLFGSGGGFTGAVTEFILLENGQLFTHTGVETQYKELKKVGRRTTKNLFSRAAQLKELDAGVNQPGNIYYFISDFQTGKERRIAWGAHDVPVSETVKELYRELSGLVAEKTKN